MVDSVTFKVEGLMRLGARMSALKQDMALKIARSATAAAAQIIKKKAVQNVIKSPSVDEGDLRDNIIIKRIRESPLTSEHIVTVRGRGKKPTKTGKRGAPHAHLVEYGTVNMPAEPFLGPAFDTEKVKAKDAMVKRIETRLKKAGV